VRYVVPCAAERRKGSRGECNVSAREARRLGEPPFQPACGEPLSARRVFHRGERDELERLVETKRAELTGRQLGQEQAAGLDRPVETC
jgi:hypothetical protein